MIAMIIIDPSNNDRNISNIGNAELGYDEDDDDDDVDSISIMKMKYINP